ncbi:hypothetical protein [Ureibacillus chungkukjangi]|uniref:Uncharacterized protein n=1 Tax=Ureibacillus chungkukjangi TaxID=1202712 RepID=A0A318TEM5_9BACL|nr:hypothetical protein [Ureibacillus chungkukjangi]MCM3390518.1 hypothetical protein [Ureibacillus chungkukjangi]PYF02310.1 hypothetical protein BJ095_1442 [Ureibacillus chungkukjangi]
MMYCLIASNKPLPIRYLPKVHVRRGGFPIEDIQYSFFVEVLYESNAIDVVEDYLLKVYKQYKDPEFQVKTEDGNLLGQIEKSFQKTERFRSYIIISK